MSILDFFFIVLATDMENANQLTMKMSCIVSMILIIFHSIILFYLDNILCKSVIGCQNF